MDIEPLWNGVGVACLINVTLNGKSFMIWRQFSAEPARLHMHTELLNNEVTESRREKTRRSLTRRRNSEFTFGLSRNGRITCSTVMEVLIAELDPVFAGKFLDRSTTALIEAANALAVQSRERQ